jgi:hypothetical protein
LTPGGAYRYLVRGLDFAGEVGARSASARRKLKDEER